MPPAAAADVAGANAVAGAVRSWAAAHLSAGAPIIVACSGGTDSLALALAARRLFGTEPEYRGHPLIGATVDHGLQAGSAGRAAAIARTMTEMGFAQVAVLTVTVDGPGGPEAAARRARYRALQELADDVPAPAAAAAVLLAHTRDDQAETVLLGLARGSGPRSIAGMLPWRAPWGRPLLAVSRADTEAACRSAGREPWHDPHNSDPTFTRVRLRREVLPLLDDVLGGGVRPALARTAVLMEQDLAALDELAAAATEQARTPDGALTVSALSRQPAAIRGRVLRRWVLDSGAGPLDFDHLSRLSAAAEGRGGPPQVRIPGGFDVVRTGDEIRLVRHAPTTRVATGPIPRPLTRGQDGTIRVASSTQRSNHRRPSTPGRVVTGSELPAPSVPGPDGSAPQASAQQPLTTHLSSGDALLATENWDPGAEHGYQGELSAVLIKADVLQAKIAELANAVAADHTVDTPPLLICVLKGAVMFVTDFARALPIPSELEFMAVTSYGSATSSSGVVRILKDLDRDITGRRVVIVEDIIDSGLTLSWLLKNLATRGPASIEVVALLRKPEAIKVEVEVRYVGFDIPTDFVVGYGLDFNERYRDLPFVGLLGEHMYR